MPGSNFQPIHIPEWAWRSDETRQVLSARDVAGILHLAQQYAGASQHRIANATGILQGRVSEILKGSRQVTALEVFERIADGLNMPDHARVVLGLAPCHDSLPDDHGMPHAEITRVFPSQAAAAEEIRSLADKGKSVDVLAARGLGILGLNDSLLRCALLERSPEVSLSVRALLLDPDSVAARRRAAEIGESAESFASGIRLSVARLRELAGLTAAVELEVYQYDSLPVWRLIDIDETMYVATFVKEWEGHASPVYKLAPTPKGALHRGFRRVFEELRQTAKRII